MTILCTLMHNWTKLSNVLTADSGELYQTRWCRRCRKVEVVWVKNAKGRTA